MRRTRTNLAVLLLFSLCTAPALAAEEDEREPPQRLVEFSLEGIDGTTFESAQRLRDRGAVITFWRVDQQPSTRILKDLKRLYDEFTDTEITIVSIVAGTVERPLVASVIEDLEIPFPVLLDAARRVYADLDVIVSPSTWFVDRKGALVDAYPGHRRDFLRVARANLAFLRGSIGEAERAKRVRAPARPVAEIDEDLAGLKVRYRFALRLLETGSREAALEQLRTAWQGYPPLADVGVTLGLLLLEDDRNAEALKVLERAAELAPSDAPLASGAHGVALIRLGHEQAGADLLRRALQQPVAEPLLYYEMAKLSERSDALEDARRYYRAGLELMLSERAGRRGH